MNVKVVFQNMKRSGFLSSMVSEKFEHTLAKFPDAKNGKVTVSVTMENSPLKPGADEFIVKMIATGLFNRESIIIAKRAKSPYEAAAEINEALQETLHRLESKLHKERIHEGRAFKQKNKWNGQIPEAS